MTLNLRSPGEINAWFERNAHRFDVPAAYLGDEPNTWRRTPEQWTDAARDGLTTVLHAPFDYAQSMGNSSLPLLSQIINEHADAHGLSWVCDRVYTPTTPHEATLLSDAGMPLWGLESRRSVAEYDLIAMTMSYPGYLFNLVRSLKWAGIPTRARDREDMRERYPLVMIGGHVYAAPFAVAPMVDILFVGEAADETAEDIAAGRPFRDVKSLGASFDTPQDNPGILAVMQDLEEYKRRGWFYDATGRERMLHELATRYSFLFVPRFYRFNHEQQDDGTWRCTGWERRYDDVPHRVRKRFVRNLDRSTTATRQPVPYTDPSWRAGMIQSAVGCSFRSIDLDARVATNAGILRLRDIVGKITDASRVMTAEGVVDFQRDDVHAYASKNVLEIELENGARLRATPEHKIATVMDGAPYDIEWLHAGDLTPGRYVTFRVGSEVFGPPQTVAEVVLDEEAAFAIGSFIGDGNFQRGVGRARYKDGTPAAQWTFHPKDQIHGERVRSWLNNALPRGKPGRPENAAGPRAFVHTKGRNVALLRISGGVKSGRFMLALGVSPDAKLVVPEAIWRSPRPVIQAFVDGLWSADGCNRTQSRTTPNGHPTSYYVEDLGTASESFAREILRLLHTLGYRSYLSRVSEYARRATYAPGKPFWYIRRNGVFDRIPHRTHTNGTRRSRAWLEKHAPDHPLLREHTDVLYVRVREVRVIQEPVEVGDVHVHAQHAFLANGFVVSNCSYCAAAYREAPYRERSQEVLVSAFRESLRNTGSVAAIPLQLEFGTYSRKKALLKQLMEEVTPVIGMPSLRVDVFGADPLFGQISVAGQKKSLTVAVEGVSERLRQVISKGINKDDILRTIANGIAAGYESAKLYMICGLPGETIEDHEEMVQLCEEIDTLRKSVGSNMRFRLSFKPLTVQSWAPYQWHACRQWGGSLKSAFERINALGMRVQIGDETRSALGTFLQIAELADDVAGDALLEVCERADCNTWGTLPRRVYDLIIEALHARDRGLANYYREKATDEVFAWDVIDTRISKAYLLRHYKNAMKRASNDESVRVYGGGFLEKFGTCQTGCTACAACADDGPKGPLTDYKTPMMEEMRQFALREDDDVRLADIRTIDRTSVRQRLTLVADIAPDRRFVSRDSWTFILRRACYLTDTPVSLTDPTFNFATSRIDCLRPWFAGREYLDMGLSQPVAPAELMARLNPHLEPWGFRLDEAHILSPGVSSGVKTAEALLWALEIDQPALALESRMAEITTSDYVRMAYRVETFRVGVTTEERNLRDVLVDAWLEESGARTRLVMTLDPRVSPYDAAAAIVGHRSDVLRYPVLMRAAFAVARPVADLLTPECEKCGEPIPATITWTPYHATLCPRHAPTTEIA